MLIKRGTEYVLFIDTVEDNLAIKNNVLDEFLWEDLHSTLLHLKMDYNTV